MINSVELHLQRPDRLRGQLGQLSSARVTNNLWSHAEINYIGIDSYFTGIVSSSAANASGTYPNETFINATTNGWINKLEAGTNGILDFARGLGQAGSVHRGRLLALQRHREQSARQLRHERRLATSMSSTAAWTATSRSWRSTG